MTTKEFLMNKRLLFSGILATALVFSLTLTSCSEPTNGDPVTPPSGGDVPANLHGAWRNANAGKRLDITASTLTVNQLATYNATATADTITISVGGYSVGTLTYTLVGNVLTITGGTATPTYVQAWPYTKIAE
jgi:hypothetical protein